MTANGERRRQGKSWLKKNWQYVVGVAGLISAIVAVMTFLRPADEQLTPPVITGDCAQVGNDNTCIVQQRADELSQNTGNPQQLKDQVSKISQAPAKGPGPWPYLVYNPDAGEDIGLRVKVAPSVEGQQVGSAATGSLLWADCYVMNNYNPMAGTPADVGPKWLRIHWPSEHPTTQYNSSSPNAPFLGWVYAGYELPFTHNGGIPRC